MSWLALSAEEIRKNPVPLAGQIVVHGLTGLAKMGDGRSPWSELPALRPPAPLPVLDHEHEWVDTTVLEDDQRVEICAAGGCSETRRVPR